MANNLKPADQLLLRTVKNVIKEHNKYSKRCQGHFNRLVKAYVGKGKTLELDGETIGNIPCFLQRKHAPDFGDIISITLTEKGKLRFHVETEYDDIKDVPFAHEEGWGVVIEDWPWALCILLQTIDKS